MEAKSWYKSKEVWVLGTAILLGFAELLAVDFPGVLADAQNLWVGIAPIIALLLRLFVTKSKLTS